MEKSKVLIIANPCSGKGKCQKIAPKVQKELESNGYEVSLLFTQKQGDAKSFAASSTEGLIICIGGDGTLNESINGLVNSKSEASVGFIPLGSTNDFGSSLGISKNWKKALKSIINGKDRELDLCKFGDRYFTYVAAHGMFAKTSCTTSQKLKNKIGHLAYLFLGVKEVFRKNVYHIKMSVGDKAIDGEYAFVGFGNTKSIGGLLKFQDDIVQMSDGLFEVLLVKYPKSLWQLSRMLKRLYHGQWAGDGLEMYHTSRVELFADKEMLWSLDGEVHVVNEDTIIQVVPSAIKIRVE